MNSKFYVKFDDSTDFDDLVEIGEELDISVLKGKTIKDIKIISDYEIYFYCKTGEIYKMYHESECCEDVNLEDICGDLNDLINSPILITEEVTNHDNPKYEEEDGDSFTWTFYKISTVKGHITIRWYGTSNGCYSEFVDFIQVK
ncbi:DUF7448 domain-containing protein [Clostridium botulinum]|uniref:DUF7448 domain-containing protein n=1 Tax=Clostridium botulinum TaxID=1491 RepID=UPI001A9A7645|nr:hypothetical protein [Clostridium botulinum]